MRLPGTWQRISSWAFGGRACKLESVTFPFFAPNLTLAPLSHPADKLKLASGTPGGSLDPTTDQLPEAGKKTLASIRVSYFLSSWRSYRFNLGLIEPKDKAWANSRKPLVGLWATVDSGDTFYTINIHLGSKIESDSIEGNVQPPRNKAVKNTPNRPKLLQYVHMSAFDPLQKSLNFSRFSDTILRSVVSNHLHRFPSSRSPRFLLSPSLAPVPSSHKRGLSLVSLIGGRLL